MKNLHILEWSLNLRSSQGDKVYPEFSNEINLISPKPDVLFLVETVKGNTISIDDYTVEAESSREGNGCSIAILNTRLGSGDIQIIKDVQPMLPGDNTPDFVQVDVSINNTIYNLIAVRIKIDSNKKTVEEFQQRKEQFDNMLDYVKNLPRPIIMGDFNHARILGDRNSDYQEIQKQHKEVQVKGGHYYQKLRHDLHTTNLAIHTPQNNNSCGLNPRDFENTSKKHGFLQLDHLVTPKNMKVNSISYNWDFLDAVVAKITAAKTDEEDDYIDKYVYKYVLYYDYNFRYKQDKPWIMKGFPDHAMLLADIEL